MKFKNLISLNLISIFSWIAAILLFVVISNFQFNKSYNGDIWFVIAIWISEIYKYIIIPILFLILEIILKFVFKLEYKNQKIFINPFYKYFIEFGFILYFFPIIFLISCGNIFFSILILFIFYFLLKYLQKLKI